MKHMLSVIAFMLVSFVSQGISHFVINKDFYASIEFMRSDPVVPMGILAMLIQGAVLTFALAKISSSNVAVKEGLLVSWAFGIFLVSYIIIVEPSKYILPSIIGWISVEGITSLIQFTVYGCLLGFIHKRFTANGRG